VKVKKIFGTDTTDYLDGFQYENGTLKFLPTAEGYFNFETGKYVYNYTDHLGNVRLSYFKNGSGAEIIEESNYYPFGLKHEGYNVLSGNPAYKYKYNGKELQETGMYDYGFRQYMPDLGRWSSLDPLSELASSWTSYRYAYDNPLRYIDPKGLFESRKEARQYRREHDLHGSIKKQKDGSYAINDRDNMISYAKGNDSDLTASDAHDNDGVVESVLVTKAPYSQKDAFDLTTTDISLFENITWKGMSTAQKSKFVWDAKKIIKTTTGLKIPGSTSSWYRAKIPKAMKGIGVAGGAVAGAVIIYDVVDSKQIKASNILDAAVTGVSFVPGWGWVVGGVFFGADMVTKGITGQSIGDHLDNYIEEKYDKDDGALIDWSKK
jgi:RHS repeat-associated protein